MKIEKIAYEGFGIGHHEGKVVLVPGTIPGDEVEWSKALEKPNYIKADLVKIVKSSSSRGASPCPYSAECGGCHWLGVDYEKQIEFKRQFVFDALRKQAKVELAEDQVETVTSEEWNYRGRVTLRGEVFQDGTMQLGFFEKGSHTRVNIGNCRVAHPRINEMLAKLIETKYSGVTPARFRLTIQYIPAFDQVFLSFHLLNPDPKFEEYIHQWHQDSKVRWAGLDSDVKKVAPILFEKMEDISYYSKPGIFQQVNSEANQKLRELLKRKLDLKMEDQVLDLYCGSGNLSLQFVSHCKRVTGVESSKGSIDCAIQSFSELDSGSARYLSQPAEKFLKSPYHAFDVIVLDPPRAGAKTEIDRILQLSPRTIAYISCNPVTMARDVQRLLDNYEIDSLTVFDFFPQTFHVETLVILTKK